MSAKAAPAQADTSQQTRPLLSVVVPVYNQPDVAENVAVIRERVESKLGEPIELIVVSDGSEQMETALAESGLARVIHYDRNMGKGYAVKAGSLAARGRFVAYIDGDLDLDPAAIPDFLRLAEHEELDFVIGSKRHPDSHVHYPASRRVGSWLYQQLVRLLFRLDVRDTQVGVKLFRREVAENVLPLLLVKQFAFDLEFLAVARALGYGRIREQPIRLEYKFTGSGVRSVAVLLALIDTAAIFYRLRILRYYHRKREFLPAYERFHDFHPLVTVVAPVEPQLDYERVEPVLEAAEVPETRAAALRRAAGEVVAFLEPESSPSASWLSSTIPFLANPRIAAVVTPSVAPAQGTLRERASAALQESWLGGGSHYFSFTPGNLRYVRLFPAGNIVARTAYCRELPDEELHPDRLVAALAGRGRLVLYTPETVVVAPRPPLFAPHLRRVAALGRARGQAVRAQGFRGLSATALAPLGLLAFLLFGWLFALQGGKWLFAWAAIGAIYVALVGVNAALGGLRFRSLRVALLAAVGSVAVHITYALSLLRGLLAR
jgi:glycosyltransferase involved in cell wall biosynthesis